MSKREIIILILATLVTIVFFISFQSVVMLRHPIFLAIIMSFAGFIVKNFITQCLKGIAIDAKLELIIHGICLLSAAGLALYFEEKIQSVNSVIDIIIVLVGYCAAVVFLSLISTPVATKNNSAKEIKILTPEAAENQVKYICKFQMAKADLLFLDIGSAIRNIWNKIKRDKIAKETE